MTLLGLALTFATIALLVVEFLRHRRAPLARYGWAGLVALIVAEGLMFRGVEPVAIYFTPIAWTCYILLADAAVLAISGHSRLHDEPRRFALVALLSKDGKMESGSDKWQATGGTGKFKGIKGSGTCKGTGSADGSTNWTCTGTYTLPK